MPHLYIEDPASPGRYIPHNPGRPIWLILLCKAVGFLYEVVCTENKKKD